MYVAVQVLTTSHHEGQGGEITIVPFSDLDENDQRKIKTGEIKSEDMVQFYSCLTNYAGWLLGRFIFVTNQEQSLLIDQVTQNHPPQFEPNIPPLDKQNVRAARARGLTFDPEKQQYVDHESVPVLDARGQSLF